MTMKSLLAFSFLLPTLAGGLELAAQDDNATPLKPPRSSLFAGPEALGTNLGVQEIVDVLRPPGAATVPEGLGSAVPEDSAPGEARVSANAGIRAYRTSNVMRQESGLSGAGVLEFSLGANLAFESFTAFEREVEPSLTFMGQRAYYGQFSIQGDDASKSDLKNVLDYEFRMLNFSGITQLNDKWLGTAAFEYNELRSFREGQKKYHAFSPVFSMARMEPLTETSMYSLDLSARYSFTKSISAYEIPGVFEDDGDNWQASLNLTYARAFGPDGRLLVLPSVGISRTHYLKNLHSGRVDYLWTAGVSAMYSLTEHVGLQAFLTYGNKSANGKGRELLGSSKKYENLDVGVAITGQYDF